MSAYVRIRVASEAYALPVTQVLEVASLGKITVVPGAPADVLGVRNLRGQILPVIDLAGLLEIRRAAPPGHLLVTEANGNRAGLVIDEVQGVTELPAPTAEAQSGLLAGSLLGADGDLIGVIDVERVFGALDRAGP